METYLYPPAFVPFVLSFAFHTQRRTSFFFTANTDNVSECDPSSDTGSRNGKTREMITHLSKYFTLVCMITDLSHAKQVHIYQPVLCDFKGLLSSQRVLWPLDQCECLLLRLISILSILFYLLNFIDLFIF